MRRSRQFRNRLFRIHKIVPENEASYMIQLKVLSDGSNGKILSRFWKTTSQSASSLWKSTKGSVIKDDRDGRKILLKRLYEWFHFTKGKIGERVTNVGISLSNSQLFYLRIILVRRIDLYLSTSLLELVIALTQWAKSPNLKIHSYRLLFRRFCPLGSTQLPILIPNFVIFVFI